MSHVRVESSVPRHPKFIQAGPAASWLWLCGLAYCQDALTDGFIPFEAVKFLGVDQPKSLITRLVKARLWDQVEGGWMVHDYLDHNKPASEINRIKQERRTAGADGGSASGRSRSLKQLASTDAKAHAKQTVEPTVEPSSTTTTATTTATATPTEHAASPRRAPLVDQREHRKHAHCGRVCLHASLFGEFVRRRNHPGADAEIRDWAMAVEREWAEKLEEPGDPFDFWRDRYDEKWPSVSRGAAKLPAWAS